MRTPIRFPAVALLLLSASTLIAGGFQLNEHGARAVGLGGAFAARASDPSAIYFNPAGLGFQTVNQISLGATVILPRVAFFGPYQLNTNTKTAMDNQTFTPPHVYGTYHFSEDLHFGIGVYTPFGLGTQWPQEWSGKFITTKADLQSFFISPTVAYRLRDGLSIGVGFNYAVGTVRLEQTVSDPFDPHGTLALKFDANSFGFNVGVLYKPSSEISVGASYRSEVAFSATGTADFTPNRPVYPEGDAKSSLTLPATGYLGVAYSLSDNLVVEADYQYVGWSSYQELAVEFAGDGSKVISPKNYRDTFVLRVGAEYTMDDWQLRGGYFFDRTPVETPYVDPLLPDANRNGLNVGLGYRLTSSLSIDAAYMLLLMDERKAEKTVIDFDGTYQTRADLFCVSLTYTF
ncbi:MAG: outer membrane protein transport protein [Ignavibacteriales bacterium]|nr:outer membrane protein transport protein [Ignavibacteriales bacterium]